MRNRKQDKILKCLCVLSLAAMSLTGCGEKEDLTPTLPPVQETQSEEQFAINVAIEVNPSTASTEETKKAEPEKNDFSNSGSDNQNVSTSLSVPDNISLSEEDAVFLDSLIYSGLSDDEIKSIIEDEDNFTSATDKEALIEDALQFRNDLALSEEFEMETIDYSNDEEMLRLMEEAEKQLKEDMTKEPVDLSQYQ